MRTMILTIAAYFICFIPLNAQSISTERRVDWSNAGVEGGIPTV